MPRAKKGSQTPTKLIKRPYKNSLGDEAAELYEKSGRKLQRWQRLLLRHIMATDKQGLWVHTSFGYSVPRQNGKNEAVAVREAWGLQHGERIIHTAHRTSTSHAAWERLLKLLTDAGVEIDSSYRASGREHIYLKNGGKIEFRTRTSTGGLGESYDTLIIDEAQEYRDDHESTLQYVITASKNPQTILLGTPPTPVSSGTVFSRYREDCIAGRAGKNAGWAEWSVEQETDPRDKAAWYATNPSLGTLFKERVIEDEIRKDRIDFNIQRLGLWIRYNLKSAISREEWESVQCEAAPEFKGKLSVGIKFSLDGGSVAMGIAVKTADGRDFVEVIDCRSTRAGIGWIIDFLRKGESGIRKVIVDGASGQQELAEEMKAAKLKPPYLPTVKDIITANSRLEPAISAGSICHAGQPSLTQAASNCEHRAIGSNGGYGYKSIAEGVDIALLDCVILARWGLDAFPDTPTKQKISY